MLLTRAPLGNTVLPPERFSSVHPVRLACVKHAASVRPEPGSNSQLLPDTLRRYLLSSFQRTLRKKILMGNTS